MKVYSNLSRILVDFTEMLLDTTYYYFGISQLVDFLGPSRTL